MFSRKIILVGYMFAILFAQRDNRIFWDGSNWNRIATKLGEGSKSVSQIKAAHLNGILDGRLYYYLKAWEVEPSLAEVAYNDPLDLLGHKELIHSLEFCFLSQLDKEFLFFRLCLPEFLDLHF